MTTKNNRFARSPFKTSPVYTCRACGKKTRETGHGEESCDLCAFCYMEGGIENSLSDGNSTEVEALRELEALEIEYDRKSKTAAALREKLGKSPADWDEAMARATAEAREARAPRPPEELVGALQDRVHAASGRLLAAKAVRTITITEREETTQERFIRETVGE